VTSLPPADRLDADVAAVLAAAGITGPHTPLVSLVGGRDNHLYATRAAGHDLIVKAPRTGRVRYGVAAWAARQLAAVGVPAPAVLGHREGLLVETRCPGRPLDATGGAAADQPPPCASPEPVAAAAGRLLRQIHTIPVHGYGRLDASGVGLRPSPASWILQLPPLPADAHADLHALRTQAQQVLRHHLHLLDTVPGRLLHGDWTARHVIVRHGRITGVVDLESVRGGDPLADLAGWSLQEPAELSAALFAGYFTAPPDRPARTRLALYRVRIAAAMLAHHATHADDAQVALRTAQLHADLADLSCQQPATHPRTTPRSTEQ
jgi:aminoglycoside phosphotransferase (APT) family kinase protein